jgi:hypothetical protein
VALRLLTGDSYWTANSHVELMVELLAGPMPNPSERWPFLGRKFDAWFSRSCHRDSSSRWNTIAEQVDGLRVSLEGSMTTGGVPMATVVDLLRRASSHHDGSPRRVSLEPSPSERPGPSEPGARTVTAFVPSSLIPGEADRLVTGTTAPTNLTHTTQGSKKRTAGRMLLLMSGAVVASILAVLAYGVATRSKSRETSARVLPTAQPTASAVEAVEPAPSPSPMPAESPPPQEFEATRAPPSTQPEPQDWTHPPARSAVPTPRIPTKSVPRVPRTPAPRPIRADDDLMRP